MQGVSFLRNIAQWGESDLQQTIQVLTEHAAPVQCPEQQLFPMLPSLGLGRESSISKQH